MDTEKASSGVYVTLSYPPLGLIGAKATGLWNGGICVDTGAIRLPFHSEVEVTLSYREGSRLQALRVNATVTERSARGTQLSFRETPPEATRALARLRAQPSIPPLEGVA